MVPCSADVPLALLLSLGQNSANLPEFYRPRSYGAFAGLGQTGPIANRPVGAGCLLPSRPSSPTFGSCLPCRTPGRLGFVQRFPPGGEDCVSRGPPHSGPMLGIRLAARAVRGGGQSISQQVGRDSRHRQLGLPPSLSSNALPSSRAIGVVPRVPRNSAVSRCWKS